MPELPSPIRDLPRTLTTTIRGGEMRQDIPYRNRRVLGSGDWLLIHTVAGAGWLTGPRGGRLLNPGETLLYAPDDYQEYQTDEASGRWHLLWCHFPANPRLTPLLQWPHDPHGFAIRTPPEGEQCTEAGAAMQRLVSLSARGLPGLEPHKLNALEAVLLWLVCGPDTSAPPEADPRIQKAIDYLTTHLHQPFDLEALARYSGLSVSRLSALFKARTHTSPRLFQEHYRMQYARELLRQTRRSITEIATDVGFTDPFYFSGRFRRYHGMSPSDFRKQPQNR